MTETSDSAESVGLALDHPDAVPLLITAVQSDPENRDLLSALAKAQLAAGRRKDAYLTYNRILMLGNVAAQTWTDVGNALVQGREYAQAIGAYRESLAVEETAEARYSLGQALFKLGDVDAAVAALDLAAADDNLIALQSTATIVPGAPSYDQAEILAIRQRFARVLADSNMANRHPDLTGKPHPPGQRIRVGYVSSWFAGANYMKPVWALINNHDRERFDIHLFSDSPDGTEYVGYDPHPRDRLHLTGEMTNTELAAAIAGAQIDVLIDLNAYSTQHRLGLFTAAPAPAVAAWFNMFATSGLPGYHYIIGDDEVVKPSDDAFFSEQVLRLPVSYLTFITAHRTPEVVDPPCVNDGCLTFGSLSTQYKMTAAVIAAWAEMLNGVPNSRLHLANRAMDQSENRNWLLAQFGEHGIAPERITLGGSAPHYDYLANYNQMDFALDAFPYNGGTTTMEAIWQGVPVLTFDGDRWASRTSQTLLKRTHLGEFCYGSRDEMVAGAIAMGNDPGTPERLHAMRHGMREKLAAAPVCDAGALARSMEDIYTRLAGR